jgi:hypothetical protein
MNTSSCISSSSNSSSNSADKDSNSYKLKLFIENILSLNAKTTLTETSVPTRRASLASAASSHVPFTSLNNNNNNNANNNDNNSTNTTKTNINNTNGQNVNEFFSLINALQSVKCLNNKQLVNENEILFIKRFIYIYLVKKLLNFPQIFLIRSLEKTFLNSFFKIVILLIGESL